GRTGQAEPAEQPSAIRADVVRPRRGARRRIHVLAARRSSEGALTADDRSGCVDHFEEAKAIWHMFVPKSGQADTVQGELLRAVEKLRDEATRNGNINWDRGFELLLAYLRERLIDPKAFASAVNETTARALDRLADFDHPCIDDDLYDALGDRVVEYYQHY